MHASFGVHHFMQVDPSKKYEVFGNITYDELGQRIARVEAVDVQETRDFFKELLFYKTVCSYKTVLSLYIANSQTPS